jgi:hypothetical protein
MTETIPKCFPANEELRTFIFFREGGVWYPIGLPPSTVADNAECDPGTLRVEDALTGEVVWRLQ